MRFGAILESRLSKWQYDDQAVNRATRRISALSREPEIFSERLHHRDAHSRCAYANIKLQIAN
jgi:hypothetical protein